MLSRTSVRVHRITSSFRMTYKITTIPILLAVLEMTLSAVVLPRPPSSPNHIQSDRKTVDNKAYNEKYPISHSQSTNVEKPNTDNYELLEFELRGRELEAVNFQNLIHAVLKNQLDSSNLEPEVVPRSDLGVRNMGPIPGFQKKVKLGISDKLQHPNEKLYYLKNGRPKVYINVISQNGGKKRSFNSEDTKFTTNYEPKAFLPLTKTDKRHVTKSYRPKKYYSDSNPSTTNPGSFLQTTRASEVNGAEKNSYDAKYELNDLSTTENSMVTSSELPKQIPAPPSRSPNQAPLLHTTPVQRYVSHRTDILPSYRF